MYRFVFILAVVAVPVLSYSTGAPDAVCKTMAPQHGPTVSQTSSPPYVLEMPKSVNAGQKISIRLRGKSSGDTIKGFIVEARAGGKPVGQFVSGPNSQTLNCDGNANALTHKKIISAITEVKFEWIAPNQKQTIDFVATVAKQGDIYWVQGLNEKIQVV